MSLPSRPGRALAALLLALAFAGPAALAPRALAADAIALVPASPPSARFT